MDEVLKYVTETGFAILVTIYLLVRMERKIENLTDSISRLNQLIEKLRK